MTSALTSRLGRLTAAAAAATMLTSGCAMLSPVQTDKPYQPADGINVQVGDLAVRNLAVVTEAKDAAGFIIGNAVNPTAEKVSLTFTLSDGTKVDVDVPAGGSVDLSADGADLDKVAAAPGTMTDLAVASAASGNNVFSVPVLLKTLYYKTPAS